MEQLDLLPHIEQLREKYSVPGAQVAVSFSDGFIQCIESGKRNTTDPVTADTWFEIASLSKSVGTYFALEYFKQHDIPLSTRVNVLLKEIGSDFQLETTEDLSDSFADRVTLINLMNHTALNMHYVKGIPANQRMPEVEELLCGNPEYGYEPVRVISEPGTEFNYSGAGFLVLEHILKAHSGKSIDKLTRPFLDSLDLTALSLLQSDIPGVKYASGYRDNGEEIEGSRFMFPAIAAGGMGTANHTLILLQNLCGSNAEMLVGKDLGSVEFIGAKIGLGIFIAEAGDNKLVLHQGANDGFRSVFIYCYEGPDFGKGLVIYCNADYSGTLFNGHLVQYILKALNFSGINFSKYGAEFDSSEVAAEQKVNKGLKTLVFDAFVRKPQSA